MGETAIFVALIVAILVVTFVAYYFRTPRNYNARELVRQLSGAGRPHDKIE